MRNHNGYESPKSIIPLRITPRAKRNEISGIMEDGTVKIRLAAPPVDGKANKALVNFLSELLDIRTSSIEIISGMKGRDKLVRINGFDRQTTLRRINNHLQQQEVI